jgi:hypothetical protein
MNRKLILPALALALAILACNLQPGTPAPAPTDTPGLPLPAGLTADLLRNATYTLEGCDGAVHSYPLANGAYASAPDSSAAGYTSISMGDLVANGDLNFDGVEDAAVILGVNCGGTGVFTYLLAVLNSGGLPVSTGYVFIDDRPMINSLSIASGEILSDILIHGSDDPMCCPAFQTQQGYRLYGSTLVRTRLATWTGGLERSINVTAPADLASVSYPLTVTGGVTIGPFENTLAYAIYAPDNTLVTSGSLMTDSPDAGLPGNFSLPVDLSMAGVFGRVRIEFSELSMKDGSVMTLDSVLVDVH